MDSFVLLYYYYIHFSVSVKLVEVLLTREEDEEGKVAFYCAPMLSEVRRYRKRNAKKYYYTLQKTVPI